MRVSPRSRIEALNSRDVPSIAVEVIHPFLAETLVLDEGEFERAPRIVALDSDMRVLIAQGDRAYARSSDGEPLLMAEERSTNFRLFRAATPLRDPDSGAVLGYEGQYVGQATLVRGESTVAQPAGEVIGVPASGEGEAHNRGGDTPRMLPVLATVDITASKEEIRPGDRMLAELPPQYTYFTPHAPDVPVDARVVSVYGNAVRFAGGYQVVAINKGSSDGVEAGQVLSVMTPRRRLVDPTADMHERVQLPSERNGTAMIFKTFSRVSYALLTSAQHAVQVGDRLVHPN